ncbi:hypothetical protein NMG60_11037456 [Bertholletia excelsa]
MIGTLTLPTGTPIRSSQVNRQSLAGAARSGREMLLGGYNPCRTSVHVFAETAPEVDVMKQAGSLYDVLRVRRNASPTEIKTAYRSLAKLYHPDASPSESSEGRDFIEIHNAYATLSDPAARALYDLSLAVGSGRRPFVYSSGQNGPPGFYRTRRWETDQCCFGEWGERQIQ